MLQGTYITVIRWDFRIWSAIKNGSVIFYSGLPCEGEQLRIFELQESYPKWMSWSKRFCWLRVDVQWTRLRLPGPATEDFFYWPWKIGPNMIDRYHFGRFLLAQLLWQPFRLPCCSWGSLRTTSTGRWSSPSGPSSSPSPACWWASRTSIGTLWQPGWVKTSQVPQLPWMSVGFPIPLKQDNLTLQHSWAFNMARTHEWVQLLDKSMYGKPLFNWPNPHTCIGCDATAAWRAPPISTFRTSNFNIQPWPLPRMDFSHIERFIFVSCTFLYQYWFNCAVSILN